jgi:uncharacterized membrane protein YphA (DoxX/SURF4 family)
VSPAASARTTGVGLFLRSWWPWLSVLARLVVGAVWITAGALKLGDPDASVRAVRAYQLLPESIVPLVGRGLPVLEVLVGALLMLGLGVRIVAVFSALLQVAFITGIAAAWARNIRIDCGCFGGGGFDAEATSKYSWEIARDCGLFALSALLARWPSSRLSLDQVLLPPIDGELRNS